MPILKRLEFTDKEILDLCAAMQEFRDTWAERKQYMIQLGLSPEDAEKRMAELNHLNGKIHSYTRTV
jgi:hypothetical protein